MANFISSVVLLLITWVSISHGQTCNTLSGPEDSIDCRSYGWLGSDPTPQWSRCISREKLRNITNGQMTCILNYCNYLCMQEFYHLKFGEIYSDCQCTPDELAKVEKNRTIIEDKCYKIETANCTWYTDCLRKRYNCNDGLLSVQFQEKLCSLARLNSLSLFSNQWLEDVRGCLMKKLALLVRPWVTRTCAEVDHTAFESLNDCFFRPNTNRVFNSICDLKCQDWWILLREVRKFFSYSNKKTNLLLQEYIKFGQKKCDNGFLKKCWSDASVSKIFTNNVFIYKIRVSFLGNNVESNVDRIYDNVLSLKNWFVRNIPIDETVFSLLEYWTESDKSHVYLYITHNQGVANSIDVKSSQSKNLQQLIGSKNFNFLYVEQIKIESVNLCNEPSCSNVNDADAKTKKPSVLSSSPRRDCSFSSLILVIFLTFLFII